MKSKQSTNNDVGGLNSGFSSSYPNSNYVPITLSMDSSTIIMPPGYFSQQQQKQSHTSSSINSSSYSPIYSSFSGSYVRDSLKSIKDLDELTAKQQSQQQQLSLVPSNSSSQSISVSSANLQQDSMFLYSVLSAATGATSSPIQLVHNTTANHNTNTGSVDYSVVSAQTHDKNVLRYYKTRQASGSSQTGVSPSPIVPQLLQQQQASLYSSCTPMISSISTIGKTLPQTQQQSSSRSQQQQLSSSSSVYSFSEQASSTMASHLSSSSASYNSNDIYGQTRMKASDIYATIGRAPHSSSIYPAAVLLGDSGVDGGGVSLNSSYGISMSIANNIQPQQQQQQQHSNNSHLSNRHSMNLALLGLGSGSSGTSSSRTPSSLMLPSSSSNNHRDSLLIGSNSSTTPNRPPLYEHHHFSNIYSLPGSSKTLPNQKHLLSISSSMRQNKIER